MASANNMRNKSPNKPLYKQKKEGQNVIDGKIVVDIEVCKNCKDHQWCTRHDESKYLKMFEEISSAILLENPNVIVTQNNFVQVPTLGAFEVTCQGALLYSKNRAGCFPHGPVLANLIKNYLIDKENGKPTNHYDLRQIESNPNKEDRKYSTTTSNFRSSNKSPNRANSSNKGTRGRPTHYTGKGNCIEAYQYVISSTFAQGKRSPDERNKSVEKTANMNSTAQSGFYQTNNIQPYSDKESIKSGGDRRDSKQSHHSNGQQQYEKQDELRQSEDGDKQHSNGDQEDHNKQQITQNDEIQSHHQQNEQQINQINQNHQSHQQDENQQLNNDGQHQNHHNNHEIHDSNTNHEDNNNHQHQHEFQQGNEVAV